MWVVLSFVVAQVIGWTVDPTQGLYLFYACFVLAVFVPHWRQQAYPFWRYFALAEWGFVGLGLVGLLGIFVFFEWLGSLLPIPQFRTSSAVLLAQYQASPLLFGLLSCGLAPLFEEWLFRGVLLHQWAESRSAWRAIVGTSLLFGILHLSYPLHAFGMALILGWIALRLQTWWPTWLIHLIWNSCLLLGMNKGLFA
ncbi:MAG: CPBP family intramembrane metalloprotease [Acidobacteria bacterium]|nr:CPBP family intramembrane metalloprotease [Acidobacteriota bacterium]